MTFSVVSRPVRDRLGEGPTWLAERNELLWVDIVAPAIHRMKLDSSEITTLPLDEPVGWVIPIAGSEDCMVGLKSGFWRMQLDTAELSHITNPEQDRPQNRFNDAKVDPWGRLWAGSKDDADEQATGALYRLDPDLSYKRMDDGYGVTNGPTFSIDGRILYHTDSAARQVYAFDLSEDGSLANKRVWLEFREEWGYPDGMTTDSEGCLWIAHWDGGKVSRFDPDGNHIRSIELPASNITSCTFAGEDLDRMFVTSSTIDREDEPLAGALFEVDPGVAGAPPGQFKVVA